MYGVVPDCALREVIHELLAIALCREMGKPVTEGVGEEEEDRGNVGQLEEVEAGEKEKVFVNMYPV